MWNYDFENCILMYIFFLINHVTNLYMLDEKIKIQFFKKKKRKEV